MYISQIIISKYNKQMSSRKQIDKVDIDEKSGMSDHVFIQNQFLLRKNYIFGLLVVAIHIAVGLLHGFFLDQPIREVVDNVQFNVNFSPIFITFAYYIFVLVGFGLLFSYNRKLVFSGIGFTLLITLLTVQFYFLINAFWTRANIGGRGTPYSTYTKYQNIFLTNRIGPQTFKTGTQIIIQRYRAVLTDAVSCGLANSIAFSSILGRAGPFEAFFVALFGTFGYELNRYIIETVGFDYGATFRVFIYGGFMGLVIGLMLYYKQKKLIQSTQRHDRYTASMHSSTMAAIGTAFIWVFFPTFVMDPPALTSKICPTAIYTTPITVLYGLASSTIMAISTSFVLNEKLMIRDLLHGPVAGGIAVASAGYYITNPVWGILIGSVAGIIQPVINYFQHKHSLNNNIITTISFGLFGINGLVGAAWASVWRAVIISRNDGITYNLTFLTHPGNQFANGLIAMCLGAGFGVIVGLIVMFAARHERTDHFYDFTYWQNDDGIRYIHKKVTPFILPKASPGLYLIERIFNVKERNSYL